MVTCSTFSTCSSSAGPALKNKARKDAVKTQAWRKGQGVGCLFVGAEKEREGEVVQDGGGDRKHKIQVLLRQKKPMQMSGFKQGNR